MQPLKFDSLSHAPSLNRGLAHHMKTNPRRKITTTKYQLNTIAFDLRGWLNRREQKCYLHGLTYSSVSPCSCTASSKLTTPAPLTFTVPVIPTPKKEKYEDMPRTVTDLQYDI